MRSKWILIYKSSLQYGWLPLVFPGGGGGALKWWILDNILHSWRVVKINLQNSGAIWILWYSFNVRFIQKLTKLILLVYFRHIVHRILFSRVEGWVCNSYINCLCEFLRAVAVAYSAEVSFAVYELE